MHARFHTHKIEVIVGSVRWYPPGNTWVTVGESKRFFFDCFNEARDFAETFAREHFRRDKQYVLRGSVTLRPHYNDPVPEPGCSSSYREWRSFDGEPLELVVFKVPPDDTVGESMYDEPGADKALVASIARM
jgi:hypothetical protein